MKIIGIIPARFASSRFPGKPLIEIHGKSMIRRVYEQCRQAKTLTDVYVATDDERIFNHVVSFGGQAIMTSDLHRTGTERCHEALCKLESNTQEVGVVINIQGDEPYIQPQQIDALGAMFLNSEVEIATLIKKILNASDIFNPNIIKVVKNNTMQAMYFSRSPIPYLRSEKNETWLDFFTYYKHIGIYAYRSHVLKTLVKYDPGMIEQAESLEQLRWLENRHVISLAETDYESHSVDVPEDLLKF